MSTDRRHKNMRWLLPPVSAENTVTDSTVTNALLMDIRDELQQLNRILGCFRLPRMSNDINRIDRRLAKRCPLPRGRKRV